MTAQSDRDAEQREHDRLTELGRYQVLDSEPELAFEELAKVAAAVARTPMAAISVVGQDRVWFKAAAGLDSPGTSRSAAFCDLVIQDDDELVVADTWLEPRLAQYPDVAGGAQYRFYAGFPLRMPSGAVLGTLCLFDHQPRSLTDDQVAVLRALAAHVMAQLQLRLERRQRDELLELAQELAEVGSWTADLRTNVVTWSQEAHRILRTDPGMPLDLETIWRYIHPEDHQKVQEAVGVAFAAGRSDVEFRVSREDGEARVVRGRYRVDRDPHGAPLRLSGIILDVTAPRTTEQELVRARDLLDQVMAAPGRTGVIGVGPDGLITVFNRGAQIMLGYTPEEMIGRVGYLAFHDLGEIAERTARFVIDPSDDVFEKATEAGQDEWTFIRKDGTRLTGQMSVSRMVDAEGNPAGHIGFLTDVTEARRAQQELIETKELFGQLLSSATEQAIIAADSQARVSIFNRGAEIMLGYTAQEILGQSADLFHDPQEGERFGGYLQEVARAATEVAGSQPPGTRAADPDWTYIRKDGHRLKVQIRLSAMRDGTGQVVGFVGVSTDVTRQRQSEAALAAANAEVTARSAQLEEAQQIAAMGSWSVDQATGTATWSREMHRILGTDPQTFVPGADAFMARVHPEDVESFTTIIDQAIDAGAGWTAEHRLLLGTGEVRNILCRGKVELGDSGQPIRVGGISQDITDIRRAQRELIDARDQFVQLLGAATDQAIVGTGPDGKINLFNRGAERMLGYTPDEAFGKSPWQLLHDQDELARRFEQWDEAALLAAIRTNFERGLGVLQIEREWNWVHKDGHRLDVQISLSPMRDQDGDISGYLSIATDVTDQRAAEQERDRAEADVQAALVEISAARDEALAANTAKSAFLATMSHEIRTPMNAVIGMTGLLLDTDLDEEQRDLLETVRGSGDQLLAIINDILDFSKIEAGDLDLEYRSFDLRELVEGTVAQFAGSARGLDLISHVDDVCPANVIGDATRLRQVLSNLISNAIKFTAEGEVLVRASCQDGPEGMTQLNFHVQDSGIGIPQESMHRLFKSFSQVDATTTRTYGGTGLGLAISKALVNAMGGEISVSSQPGAGSTFIFSVLVGHDDTVADVSPASPDAELRAALRGRRVLIVDDNATHRQILTLQLGNLEMQTVDAGSPIDALHLLSDTSERFDLAILDLALPVLDGVQLATAIRRLPRHSNLPLVLLAGLGRRLGDDEQLFAAILTKPVRSAALTEGVARAVDPASQEQTPSRPDATASRPGGPEVASSARSLVPSPSPPPDQNPSTGTALRILLAEDNEVNQKVGRLMLAKLGYHPEIVDNGEQALEAAQERDFDVILMDMHMPVMDGLEATRRIRAELPPHRQPRIVALTASVTIEDREACAAAGMDRYLSKPVRPEDLAAALVQGPVVTP